MNLGRSGVSSDHSPQVSNEALSEIPGDQGLKDGDKKELEDTPPILQFLLNKPPEYIVLRYKFLSSSQGKWIRSFRNFAWVALRDMVIQTVLSSHADTYLFGGAVRRKYGAEFEQEKYEVGSDDRQSENQSVPETCFPSGYDLDFTCPTNEIRSEVITALETNFRIRYQTEERIGYNGAIVVTLEVCPKQDLMNFKTFIAVDLVLKRCADGIPDFTCNMLAIDVNGDVTIAHDPRLNTGGLFRHLDETRRYNHPLKCARPATKLVDCTIEQIKKKRNTHGFIIGTRFREHEKNRI